MFKVKRVKRKCNVLGCRHTDCYALTALGEYGNSVVICKDCLEKALDCINEREKAVQKPNLIEKTEPEANNPIENVEPDTKMVKTSAKPKRKPKKGS